MQSSVVIFRVHEDSDLSREALAKLRAELPDYRIEVVSYLRERIAATGVFQHGYMVDPSDLRNLPYSVKLSSFNPDDPAGYNELPVMHFFKANPHYEFYWIVEYDVHYSGCWGLLFDVLSSSRADLLGTSVANQSENPEWFHWNSMRLRDAPLSPEIRIKSFMPFGRASRAALEAIDEAYIDGLTGHPEGTWPTICRMRNLTIEDIGGDGSHTPERWKNKHYWNTLRDPSLAPGSFVFRPPIAKVDIDASAFPPLLWHPVKF